MRLALIIIAALMILGVSASALILVQKGNTQTAAATSTSETQEVAAPPARAPVHQAAQAAGSEASPLILQANVGTQSDSPMAAIMQDDPVATATVPNVKDQSASTIAKATVHET